MVSSAKQASSQLHGVASRGLHTGPATYLPQRFSLTTEDVPTALYSCTLQGSKARTVWITLSNQAALDETAAALE